MITDFTANHERYYQTPAWREAFAFAAALPREADPGRYELASPGSYALLFTYETIDFALAVPELHREYVDVQIMLEGNELHALYSPAELEPSADYDPTRDIGIFYPPRMVNRRLPIEAGQFAVYFPNEVHMTKGTSGLFALKTRKLVVKLKPELLDNGRLM